jgi:hypothetical protein
MAEFFYDTESILDDHINSILANNPDLKDAYDILETEDERIAYKESLIASQVDNNTLPHEVEKFLMDTSIEDNPDSLRLNSVEYNEFKDSEILLAELIPTRESFEVKKTIFTVIGYLYRILDQEYKQDNPNRPAVEEFLNRIFEYNPEKHYRELDKHVDSHFKVENGVLVGDANTFKYNPELSKLLIKPMAIEQMRNIFKYRNSFSNEIRELTCQFFLENPGTEAVILPHGVFKNMEETDAFCKKYYDKFVTDPMRVQFRHPTILSDFYIQKQNSLVYSGNDNDQIINSIFEAKRQERETVQKIMEHRSQKKMQKLSNEDIALLRKYESTRKELMRMPQRSDTQIQELAMTESKIDNIKKKMIPEGTKPIIVKDLETKKESVILTEI